ncbi:YaeQ family protein [Nitratidesulfovibrio vulgaris]|nr:YaeQ family protein [Nitratidesulfovibrio vulgaris]ADP85524.1 YaeQ family protein [Nitratidesulfovibrio vulgaris RCH1]
MKYTCTVTRQGIPGPPFSLLPAPLAGVRAAGSITHGESGVSRRTGPPKNDPFRHGRSANATPQSPFGTATLAPGTLAPSPRQATVPDLQRRFLLQAAEGELAWHIALKLIAFILWMEHEPQVEMGVGWHYKPDVVIRDADGKVRLWGDCGNIAVRKIERVAGWLPQDGVLHILRRGRRDAGQLADSLRGKGRDPSKVRITAFDDGFVDGLAASLDTTNRIEAVCRDADLTLSVSNRKGVTTLASHLHAVFPA